MTAGLAVFSDNPNGAGADHANSLAAMIDQLQEKWELGDAAANDDLVLQIRQRIHRQRRSIEPGRRR
ncbi:MAG: hypothetical protein ACRDTT_12325 [Pseudonocardiaceae bacterium]